MTALGALEVARLAHLSQAYWAAITAVVITQSSLGAALEVSRKRVAGTAIGAALGAAVGAVFGGHAWVFAVAIFLAGLVVLDRSAYRFAGVTLAIVLIVPRSHAIWNVALNRFVEVSIGIAVALLVTWLWPEGTGLQAGG